MRKIAVVLLLSGGVTLLAAPAFASCTGVSVPMNHAGAWLVLADAGRVSASAFQLSNPGAVHTGPLDIACEQLDPDSGCLFNPNVIGDNIVTIETDWGNTGIIGCPLVGTDPQRVVIVAQGTDGSGIALSVEGDAGYILEFAHPSADCSSFGNLTANAHGGRPNLVAFDGTTLQVQCTPVPLFTDCDPGSCGELAGLCVDGFSNASVPGQVYEKVAPCGTDPGTNRASWLLRSDTVAGNATFAVTPPADTSCLYIGCTSRLGPAAVESGAVTGYIQIAGALAPAARALDVRATQAQGNVQVIWRTESEFELAGFNILAHGSKGTVKVNDALIAGKGNGSGYTEMISMGSLKGAKSISVEAVLTTGGASNITGPIDIGK